jgi:outer membrane protein TolC
MPRSFAHGCSLVLLVTATARTQPSDRPTVTLDQLIARGLAVSPEIQAANAGLAIARAKKDQADGTRFPQLELTVAVGPSTRARGNVVSSPDSKDDPDVTGVFVRNELSIVQPLYTFGRISALRHAAREGVEVGHAAVVDRAQTVRLRIKELYYGILLGQDILGLFKEVDTVLGQGIAKTQRALQAGVGDVDEKDLNTLKSFQGELYRQRADAAGKLDLARVAMRALTGMKPGEPFALAAEGLQTTPRELPPEAQAVDTALAERPEMAEVRAGLRATEALVRVERGVLFPQFFAAIQAYYAYASNRDFQDNPFLFDPINDRYAVVVLGLRYTLDFGITLGRIREARAQHQLVEAAKSGAELGIPLEVRRARRDVQTAVEVIHATEDGWHAARKWLVAASANYDAGIGSSWDLGEAAGAYARLKAEHLAAMFDYQVALAELEHAMGTRR